MRWPVPLVLIVLGFGIGCQTARVPDPATAKKVTTSFFKKYGKKFKKTGFGQHRVTNVEIDKVEEVQKEIAMIDAYIVLGEGQAVHKVNLLVQKKALSWKVTSWENAGAD